jgi:hypothetical protein
VGSGPVDFFPNERRRWSDAMIHEFAIDPAVLVAWTETREGFSYIWKSFGLGCPRLVSRYPRQWKALAMEAWKQLEASARTDQEKLDVQNRERRFTALLQALSEKMIARDTLGWVDKQTWLENAIRHAPKYFRAVIAQKGTASSGSVVSVDDLVDNVLWDVVDRICLPRDASAMADCVGPILKRCTEVVFVDPHFDPAHSRFLNPMRAFFLALERRDGFPSPKRIEILTKFNPDYVSFPEKCQEKMVGFVPEGWRVAVVRLKERTAGEELHNRYVLTDMGGVYFGVGLDESYGNRTDDVNVLGRAQYEKRWDQYAVQPLAFDVVDTIDVRGPSKQRSPPLRRR